MKPEKREYVQKETVMRHHVAPESNRTMERVPSLFRHGCTHCPFLSLGDYPVSFFKTSLLLDLVLKHFYFH